MIVKNEEKWLPAILADIRHFADEIAVIDTGSTDSTPEILKKYQEDLGPDKVKLGTFEWCEDFGAARNESLKLCSGKYIMWVDADDRIIQSQQLLMRHLKRDYLTRPDLHAYLLQLLAAGNTTDGCTEQLRIFPKVCEDMWSGKAHESTYECLCEHGITLRMANVYVYHEGYLGKDILEEKIRRNIDLIRDDIKKTDNPIKKSYLAGSLYMNEEVDECLGVMAEIYDNENLKAHNGQYFTYLMRFVAPLMKKEQHKALFGVMEMAKKVFPRDPQPWGVQAQLALLKGQVELARELAAECLTRKHRAEAGVPIIGKIHEKMRYLLEATEQHVYAKSA